MRRSWLVGVLALGACGADAGPGAGPADASVAVATQAGGEALRVLAQGERQPGAIAVDERYVYWATRDALRRAPLAGGEARSLVTGVQPGRVVAAEGYVFFSDSQAGTVTRVAREDGSARVVGRGVAPDGIAVRDGRVYWSNGGMTAGEAPDGSLASAALDGSDPRVLLSGVSQPAGLAVDAENVYFASASYLCRASTPDANGGDRACLGGGVARLPRDGGMPVALADHDAVQGIALGTRGAYWLVGYPTRVMFAAFGAQTSAELAPIAFVTPGPFAVQDDVLYLAASEQGRVLSLPLEPGAEPMALAVDLGPLGGIAVDRDWAYATLRDGRVLRLAKDGSAAKPAAPVTGPCPMPLETAEEIAATPRQDTNLELLALRVDDARVVASEETYQRVLADVRAIRALAPDLADVMHAPRDDGKSLLLSTTDAAMQSMLAGEYSAWDCLNTHYGLEQRALMTLIGRGYVELTLKGLYNLRRLSALYLQLPGIVSAEPNLSGGGGPTICALRSGPELEYVVDRASGDCFLGCTEHDARRFVSSAAGAVQAAESWNSQKSSTRPAWFDRICQR